jgi:hypothetical protein
VRYEELYRDPDATLQRVVAFLGHEWSPAAMHEAIAANTVDEVRRGGGTRIPVRGAFATSSGAVEEPEGFVRKGRPSSWKRDLSWRQRAIVRMVAGAGMEELGYVSTPGAAVRTANGVLRAALDAALQLHRRRKP